jgi:mannose-6-phosphate isomerase-like protein (cupin superfamily)
MKAMITAALALMALGGAAAAQGPAQPRFVAAKDLDALAGKMTDGLASAPVPAGPNVTALMVRRDRDGEVEVHTKLADELIMREGHARIRVGGTVTGQRQTAPDEFRGGTLTGGTVYDFNPGDVIYIPVGVPHQMLTPAGTAITYMAFKFQG